MFSGSDYDTILACILTSLAFSVCSPISEDRAVMPLGGENYSLCLAR